MAIAALAALGLLSVYFWLTGLAAILLALRLHREQQFNNRLVAVLARPRPQRRSDLVR